MRRSLLVLLAALVISLLAVSTASAITYGQPDGNEHSYVGLVVFYDTQGTPTHRCSGTLLSPTVFLTAGHCTDGTASAQVWFDSEVTTASGYPLTGGVKGTPYTHPDFGKSFPNTSDVGVVVLNQAVNTNKYGELPKLGILDALATRRGHQDETFTVVGYGLQEVKPNFQADRVRYKATSKLVNLRSALTDGYNIHTSNNPGIGGGTCFGDSGGPLFLDSTNTVVGITSFGLNQNCKGADFAYRTDIANAQNFILSFLTK
jgi:secreted trypsin-like serine protease